MLDRDTKVQGTEPGLKHINNTVAGCIFVNALVSRIKDIDGIRGGSLQPALKFVEKLDKEGAHILN